MFKWHLVIILPLITACLGPVAELYPEDEGQRTVEAYIISHGWHVGIAFRGNYLREELPRHERMPRTEYLMVGWGDNKYYPAEDPGVGLFLRAAFWPTGSVIHVVGMDRPVEAYFIESDIVKVQLSDKGMDEMSEYIGDSFKRGNSRNLISSGEGFYSNSTFFEANGLYFFPTTSNRWVARVLRESGFPITPFYAFTSGNVIFQVGKEGEVIRSR